MADRSVSLSFSLIIVAVLIANSLMALAGLGDGRLHETRGWTVLAPPKWPHLFGADILKLFAQVRGIPSIPYQRDPCSPVHLGLVLQAIDCAGQNSFGPAQPCCVASSTLYSCS